MSSKTAKMLLQTGFLPELLSSPVFQFAVDHTVQDELVLEEKEFP